jgi:hypothetical protein
MVFWMLFTVGNSGEAKNPKFSVSFNKKWQVFERV